MPNTDQYDFSSRDNRLSPFFPLVKTIKNVVCDCYAMAFRACGLGFPIHRIAQMSLREHRLYCALDGRRCVPWNRQKHVEAQHALRHITVIHSWCISGHGHRDFPRTTSTYFHPFEYSGMRVPSSLSARVWSHKNRKQDDRLSFRNYAVQHLILTAYHLSFRKAVFSKFRQTRCKAHRRCLTCDIRDGNSFPVRTAVVFTMSRRRSGVCRPWELWYARALMSLMCSHLS